MGKIQQIIKKQPLAIMLELLLVVFLAIFFIVLIVVSPSLLVAAAAIAAIFYVLNKALSIPFGNDIIIMIGMAIAAVIGFFVIGSAAFLLIILLFVFLMFDVEEYIDDKYVHKHEEHPVSSGQQPADIHTIEKTIASINKKISKAMGMMKRK